jgi:hypothetical protein
MNNRKNYYFKASSISMVVFFTIFYGGPFAYKFAFPETIDSPSDIFSICFFIALLAMVLMLIALFAWYDRPKKDMHT